MHSSRMRTGRSLTVCWSVLPGGGGLVPGGSGVGGYGLGGVCPGRCLLGGGGEDGIPVCTEADPPVNRMNDRQVLKYYLGHNFVAAGNKTSINQKSK